MRLIDADTLMECIDKNCDDSFAGMLNALVRRQPTAFDKEKVIEQLNRCRVYQFQGILPDGRVCHFSDVIEIVEKGGIE